MNATLFWYRWSSWVVELLSGLGVATAAQLVIGLWLQFAIAMVLSLVYERWLDVNGWSTRDVCQRMVGIVVGLVIWRLIRGA